MHPLLAASLSTQLERTAAAPRPRRAASRGTPKRRAWRRRCRDDVVIRAATPADAAALDPPRLARRQPLRRELLADAAADHAVLVAEVDGSVEAALALDGGLAVADPFRPSALDLQLLSIRARQLGGDVPRRRGHRLGVLHPRTS